MDKYTISEESYKKGLEDGKPKWIPVADQLPEPFVTVYVYDNTEKRVTDAYLTRHLEWVGVRMNHEVTHWMPLPKLPKEVCPDG